MHFHVSMFSEVTTYDVYGIRDGMVGWMGGIWTKFGVLML